MQYILSLTPVLRYKVGGVHADAGGHTAAGNHQDHQAINLNRERTRGEFCLMAGGE